MTCSFLISSHNAEETRHIGEIIGEMAEAGTIIALRGDLGSGKTALVQGIARGLEVPETVYVTSPSYTLINEYPGRLTLFPWSPSNGRNGSARSARLKASPSRWKYPGRAREKLFLLLMGIGSFTCLPE
jgi:hypothetical protein